MVPWAKELLSYSEDLSLDPQIHMKMSMVACVYNLSFYSKIWGGRGRKSLEVHVPASLVHTALNNTETLLTIEGKNVLASLVCTAMNNTDPSHGGRQGPTCKVILWPSQAYHGIHMTILIYMNI